MTEKESLKKIVDNAIKRANQEMPNIYLERIDIEKSLYGRADALLDSLNLITFVFIVEEEYERIIGKKLKITTHDVLSTDKPPFQNLANLSEFLEKKMHE